MADKTTFTDSFKQICLPRSTYLLRTRHPQPYPLKENKNAPKTMEKDRH